MAREITKYQEKWQPVEGSHLANLFAEFEAHQAERERLHDLRGQRESALSAAQNRLENIQPDADPQTIINDRLLMPVLADLADKLRRAARKAADEVDKIHSKIDVTHRGLMGLENMVQSDEVTVVARQQHEAGMNYWVRLPAEEAPEKYSFPQMEAWWIR